MRKVFLLISLLISISLFSQPGIEVVNIENEAVSDYMKASKEIYSSNNNYSISIVSKYNNSKYGNKLHWPRGKKVVWSHHSPISEISNILISVSEESDYSSSFTFIPSDKSATSYEILNLIPHRLYYYKIEEILLNGNRNLLLSGIFRTEGQVRMIQVPNCSNVRDIGGWPSQYGGTVRYGRLFRSGSLNSITSEGRHKLIDNLGVVSELDLRYEVNQSYSSLGRDKDYDRRRHEAGVQGLKKSKADLVKDLRWIIKRLDEGKNVDWHCAIGCDRCGLVSFVIEGLLGLSELDLSRDFELSTFSLRSNNQRPRAHIKSMLDYIKKYGPSDDLAKCFYNYWLEIGMHSEELNHFLGIMLDNSEIQSNINSNSLDSTADSIRIPIKVTPSISKESIPRPSPKSISVN